MPCDAPEIAAAFPPPAQHNPLQLDAAPTPGQIESRLTLHVLVPLDPPIAGAYNMAQVTYQVRSPSRDRQILERIHVPCSGPATNQPVTNSLLEGRFTLVLEAITNGVCRADWPPARDTNAPSLPEAIRLTLTQPGKEPLTSTALIQTAHGISAPGERPGEGGQPHYELVATVEVPEGLDPAKLRAALEEVADRLVLDVELAPL